MSGSSSRSFSSPRAIIVLGSVKASTTFPQTALSSSGYVPTVLEEHLPTLSGARPRCGRPRETWIAECRGHSARTHDAERPTKSVTLSGTCGLHLPPAWWRDIALPCCQHVLGPPLSDNVCLCTHPDVR